MLATQDKGLGTVTRKQPNSIAVLVGMKVQVSGKMF